MERNIDPLAKKGMRIHLTSMDTDDPNPIDSGLEGTIYKIDSLGTIHVNWDDGRILGVIPGIDEYYILPPTEEQIKPDEFMGMFGESSDVKISTAAKRLSQTSKPVKNVKLNLKRALSSSGIKVESEKIQGGKAENMTPKDLSKKHKVDIKDIEKEINVGIKIEMEHTDSKKIAKEIAMDHIAEFSDYYTNKKHGVKASEKGLEKDLEETATASSAGAYSPALFGGETTVEKPKAKKLATKIITKGDLKNPLGKIYSFGAKTESKIFKVGDLLSEIASTHAAKLRAAEGTYDGDPWVGKKGWMRKDELTWPGGEISDILAKMDINWNDSDITLTDKETDKINEGGSTKTKESPIHKKKWERCVKDVKKQNKKDGKDYNPYAVCTASIGYEGSIKKPHRKKDKKELEETTTFSSVFSGGFPVTPFMFAKKGKHIPSKKPIWKGGKIVQKANKADLLGESLLDEINKIKWVKGGKFVKIKDKCAKYNNQPHCSQGAIDDPLELSDTVFENIKNISKKTGIKEGEILDKIKAKLRGVTKEKMEYNKKHGLPIWWEGSKEGFYEKMEPRNNNTGSN